MSRLSEEQSGSISTSPSSKLKEIFETLSDINLEGQIEDRGADPLGLGASSDIFRARYTSRDKIVAVKRIRIFLLDNISFASNLGREVRLWSKLDHPNVLQLLGYFLEGSKLIPNLVSEWMKNGTLIDYMICHPFDAMEMCTIICEIASGLHYIHTEHSMIHADLKGSNILISDDGRPLLADFGLSVSSGSTSLAPTTYHGLQGSLRWMAKELHFNSLDDIWENPQHTVMTDIWAFGMVIYELLARKIPYESINDRRIPLVIARGVLPQEPDFRSFSKSIIFCGLWGIARDCWCDNPLQRPSAFDIYEELLSFKHDFENIQTGVKAAVDASERTQDFVLGSERLRAELKESKLIIRALTHSCISTDQQQSQQQVIPQPPPPPGIEEWEDTYLTVLGMQDAKQLRELLARSDPEVVLPTNGPGPLSQAVILTLVHRLAAAVSETSAIDDTFKSTVWWLRRVSRPLNTIDPLISPYIGRVLPNVQSMLNTAKQRLALLPGGPQVVESTRLISDIQDTLSHKQC